MTKPEYIQFHEEFCRRMIDVTKKKNADYSGAGDDPFNNFRHIGNFVKGRGLDIVAVGFLTRLTDKFARIGSFIDNGELQVKDESVEDTLLDIANYAALFAGYLKEAKHAAAINSIPMHDN